MVSNRRLLIGGFLGASSGAVRVAIQFAMVPVLARILGPDEFGLYAVAMPTIGFLLLLADGGLGASMAREEAKDTVVWSTAFWAVNVVCLALALSAVAWSFLLAAVSHQAILPPMTSVLALAFLFVAVSVVPGARLTRQGRLDVIAMAEMSGAAAGAIAALIFALSGGGAWSLVAQYLTGFFVRASILNIAAPFWPTFTFRWRVLRSHLAIGGSMVGGRLSDYGGRVLENTLLTRFLGIAPLGAFTFANQVTSFLVQSLGNPAWANLYYQTVSRPPDVVLYSYYKITRVMAIILLPTAALTVAISRDITSLFMGPQWDAAGRIIPILLPAVAINAIAAQIGAMLYARGRAILPLTTQICSAGGRLAAVLLAPYFGIEGVAWGVSLSTLIVTIGFVVFAIRNIGADIRTLLRNLVGPFICAAFTLLVALSAKAFLGSTLQALLAVSGVGLLTYVIFMVLFDRRRLHDDLVTFGRVLGRG